MKRAILLFFTFILLSSVPVYAIDLKNLAAYPVPFNPRIKILTVDNPTSSFGAHRINFSVYDVNGDLVIRKTLSAFPVKWNGRTGNGTFVKPGLYILKIEVDDIDGTYGKKNIRILVDY